MQRSAHQSEEWIARLDQAISGTGSATLIGWDTPLGALPPLERALASLALGLSENTAVIIADSIDPLPGADGGAAFLAAVDRLAPASTTVILGAAHADTVAAPALSRPVDQLRPAPLAEGAHR